MSLTQKQVSELYVAIFNRASEGEGNKFWQQSADAKAAANSMLDTQDAKAYFGTSLDSNQAFIEHIYKNTLNKEPADDEAGIKYWVDALNAGTSRGEVVASLVAAVADYASSTDPVTKAAYDQFNNRVEVSNYMADTLEKAPADYKTSTAFATSGTTGLVVTNSASTVTTAKTSVDTLTIDGTTFTLTASTTGDTLVGTEKSDLFNATTLNTLQNNDILLDSTTTDSDILNATVTTNNVSARIQNIETINVTGEYVTTGLALTNVSGTKTLNLDTKLAGGTAKVTDANSINAAAIKAGANISTLEVTSLSSGTRDTVTVDGGNADVTLIGQTTGADKYSVTVAKDKTLTLDTLDSSGDVVTANSEANFKLSSSSTGTAGNLKVVVNNTSANAITVDASNTVPANALAKTVELTGGAVTLKGVGAAFSGVEVTSTATKSTIALDSGTSTDLSKAQVSEVLVSAATTSIKVNENSKLVLAKDLTALTLDIDNAKGNLVTGTLLLDVNASQTATITTGSKVDTVLLTAGKLADKDGKAQTVTIADFKTDAKTDTIVVNGANDLVISKLTGNGDEVISATAHTGKLTINDFTANTKVFSGSNDDTFKVSTGTTKVLEITSGAGNDTVDLGASTADNKINLGEGDDTITTGAGANEITLGAGKDTVIIGSALGGATIADAVIGQDKIILTGAATAGTAINVAALGTITAGSYATAFGANHAFTLTGSTASDLSGLVQFGKQAVAATATTAAVAEVAYAAAVNVALTTGSFNDVVSVAASSGNINLGAGDDKIIVNGAQTGKITGGAGSDTFEIKANATITDLGATDILKVNAVASSTVSVDVVESFTATAATTNAVASATTATTTLNLKDGVNVDMTLATLAAAADGYIIKTDDAVTTGATIVGSRGNDIITGSKFADTITGGEGADTITGGAGNDTIILTESVSAVDTVVLGTVTAAGIDTIVGFTGGTDVIQTVAGGATNALALTDKGTLDKATYATLDAALASFAAGATNATTAMNAYTFKYDSKDYLLIDNGTNGYDAATDSVVEITGLVGTLVVTDIFNAS